jgi:hypothetical protein
MIIDHNQHGFDYAFGRINKRSTPLLRRIRDETELFNNFREQLGKMSNSSCYLLPPPLLEQFSTFNLSKRGGFEKS